jgi:ubiquinone/menaquinone biosynthesis C-methylase UbiE
VADGTHYVIRGGLEGRERLRLLSRVMQPTTSSFIDKLGPRDGMTCLDAGCGGGDVTLELARRVAPTGKAVGVDMDDIKLALARAEAAERGIANVEFVRADIHEGSALATYDVVYARFLLTHLSDPGKVVSSFYRHSVPAASSASRMSTSAATSSIRSRRPSGGFTSSIAPR